MSGIVRANNSGQSGIASNIETIDSDDYVDVSIDTAHIGNDQVTLAKMAGGTDGQIITYDASGDPVAVGPGSDGQVLTSTGAGSPPAFEDAAGGGATIVTGTYTGDGTTARGITGVGFEPKFVMITYQKAAGAGENRGLVWTWASLTGAQSVDINNSTYSYGLFTFLIKSLDSDGFTVDDDLGDSHPNKNSETYRYLAIG